jgi:hypothetical protein
MRLYLQFPLLHTGQLYTFSVFQPQHHTPACLPVNMLPTHGENVYCELHKKRKGTFGIRYCHFQRRTTISVSGIPLCYINRIKRDNLFFQHIINKQTFLHLIITIIFIINNCKLCWFTIINCKWGIFNNNISVKGIKKFWVVLETTYELKIWT